MVVMEDLVFERKIILANFCEMGQSLKMMDGEVFPQTWFEIKVR